MALARSQHVDAHSCLERFARPAEVVVHAAQVESRDISSPQWRQPGEAGKSDSSSPSIRGDLVLCVEDFPGLVHLRIDRNRSWRRLVDQVQELILPLC
jgi:hypothetical protein